VIGLGGAGGGEGVKAHRELLVSPLLLRRGQHVARSLYTPASPVTLMGDPGFLGDFTDHRCRGRLADFNAPSRQLPVAVIGPAYQQDLTHIIAHDRKGRWQQFPGWGAAASW